MDDADDVVGLVAPQRDAGVGAGQDGGHQFGRRQAGVQGGHGAAMGHHLADFHIVQIQDRAQHAPLLPDLLRGGVDLDGAAQFGHGRVDVRLRRRLPAPNSAAGR